MISPPGIKLALGTWKGFTVYEIIFEFLSIMIISNPPISLTESGLTKYFILKLAGAVFMTREVHISLMMIWFP